jgi:integrase
MMAEWIRAGKGFEYREHPSRKHGIRPDRYFRGRYKVDRKTVTVAFGWESEGKPGKGSFHDRCMTQFLSLKSNARHGSGPVSLKEKRKLEAERQEKEKAISEKRAKENMTFGEYFEKKYYPDAKTSKKQRSYEQEFSHFTHWLKPVLGEMPLKDIRPLHLERVKRNMLNAPPVTRKKTKKEGNRQQKKGIKGRSPRMIQYVFSTFRQVWNHARRNGFVAGDWPGKGITIPKVENRRMRFLSDGEADLLLDKLRERSQQLHDICLLSLDAGLRAGEIFSLRWNRVDLEKKTIKVFDSKGRDRVVFMTDRVEQMLQGLPREGKLIFLSRTGERIKEISNAFDQAVKDLGLNEGVTDSRDKLVFHSLRHSFASRLVERGIDLYTVKELMGHSTLAMTERYSHLQPNKLKSAIDSLGQGTASKVVPLEKTAKK